jgi:3-phenylpropionate/trans-cinnamate dioxygenase subunit alpha
MAMKTDDLRAKVDWENGLISPDIFISQDIYEEETEKLFGRTWLFLAHDSMIPKPGDFFSTYMGADPVLVIRQKDGRVRAFLNVCRHRGMKVCRAESGNTPAFTCTYHGWTYDSAGDLVSVPNFEDAYHSELDMENWGLKPVAQVDSYKGLIFGNFDPTAPPLIDYLGDMTYFIDGWLDETPGGIEVLPGTIKWTIHGNWKMAAEQFAGDGYHAQTTHLSSLGLIVEDYPRPPVGRQFASRLGHGQGFPLKEYRGSNRFGSDVLQAYQESKMVVAEERLGRDRVNGPMFGHFTVFPNFSGLAGSANIRVWHPKGPNKFEIWSWTIVDKDAPPEVKALQQRGAIQNEGAGGIVEIDDGENWDLIGAILSESPQARKLDWNYRMGLGHEHDDDPVYPGRITDLRLGETPQRGFYRRWLEFMTTDDWPSVPEAG